MEMICLSSIFSLESLYESFNLSHMDKEYALIHVGLLGLI